MTGRALVVAAAVLVGVAGGPAHAQPPAVRFAIVIGNNLPENPRAAVLRFADDDALAMHRLLIGAGVHSALLARLDDTSRQLHPDAVPDGLPRWNDLAAAFDRFARDMQRERAAGREVELFLYYSGHGDVSHGEGYVLLEDRHLTRTVLADLLERSPATRNHVVIDACKSYFLAFEKGPGGHRARFSGSFAVPAELSPGRLANTGFVLSTSSDRDSHEWERFGAGVFSHEVRSALLGAADIDRDGRISYAELGAFLTTASQAVTNPRVRPDFLVRPPGGSPRDLSETLLRWDGPARSAVVLDREVGHVYVETAAGERVLDVHPAPQQELIVRVPTERPLFVRRDDASGGEYVVGVEGPARVSDLELRDASVSRRGAAQLAFEDLFAAPFGPASVRDYRQQWNEHPLDGGGDADPAAAPAGATARAVAGAGAVISGAVAVVVSGVAIERYASGRSASQAERDRINHGLRELEIGAGILGAVAVASGAVWFVLRDRSAAPDDGLALTLVPTLGAASRGVGLVVGRAW
ncbi:MAG TPA: caspase family protein [Kofleriaceae bacterium]|nr:caspase family protein [Kofleriaceae bacterium]